MNQNLHKPVYIPSIEANDLYIHMHRGKDIKFKHVGMLPSSLELNKLIHVGIRTYKHKPNDKFLSDDIINVKFRQKVKSATEMISVIKKKIKRLDDAHLEYKNKLINYVQLLKQEKSLDKWCEVSSDDLRTALYIDGFTLTKVNEKTKKVKTTKYVVYKRSSAKSRVGECLFIKESLRDEMINWSRMGLTLDKIDIDVPSLLAYQSLVGSSLDGTLKIRPKNILIVDDIESKFKKTCSVVRKGQNGLLDSFEEEVEISNSLFDGESLLESKYFPEGKSMLLLRNHMFKSAAFNCNIQLYLRDNCPDHIDFDQWQIEDMFGNPLYAKNIHYIITPSSLKALKFSRAVGSEKAMFGYWKDFITDENDDEYSEFGVVKSEKCSRHGMDDNGNVLQQTSYQMINCLPMSKEDVQELIQYEDQYIERLKNDDDFFIKHAEKSVNDVNSNEMFINLYNRNQDIAQTKLFRDFRKAEINRHVTHVRHGKVRLRGDYCTLLGNPMELLAHAIGKFNVLKSEPTLKQNEIHTTLFNYDKELVGFRNPNTSPSNALVAKNVFNGQIEKYFSLNANIVCVNAIEFPLQDILSGSDYDSDTLVIFDNDRLLELAKMCADKYKVCINKVESSKKQYKLTELDMSIIDNQLAMSQKNIGRVVNLGQFCMSRYWDLLNREANEEELSALLKKIDIMTVLSGICIDLAKKFYDIDIENEVDSVAAINELDVDKPLFWQYVSQNSDVKTSYMNCPMDHLYQQTQDFKYAEQRDPLEFKELLINYTLNDGDRKQGNKIVDYIEQMCRKINRIHASIKDEDERNRALQDIIRYYEYFVAKLKVKPETMYRIMINIANNKKSNISSKLMNVLFKTQRVTFLNAFSSKNSPLF